MKKLTFFLAAIVFWPTGLSAQAAQRKLPWYFPEGVIQTTDPILQLKEYYRNLAAQYACFQGMPGNGGVINLIPGSDSIRLTTDIKSTANVLNEETKMVLVLDHYVRIGDKIRVTSLCGQRFITEEELRAVIDDLVEQTKLARDAQFAYSRRLTDKAVRARAEHLGVSPEAFTEGLDKRIPGTDITYRELNQLPKPQKLSDFVPKELHLGFSPRASGILGVTWLNSGIVYYNPQGRVRDHIMGRPLVLQHEIVHANPNMQRYPFTGGFDSELLASIPEMLVPDNKLDLFFHPYVEPPIRSLIRIYFGFDSEQAKKEVFLYDFAGQLDIDEEKLRIYMGQLEEIKAELLAFFEEVVLPEYYSKPLWWMAMNDRRRDDNSVFRIMMAIHYDPTSKGGRENTMLWGEKNKSIIYRIAEESFKEMRDREEVNTQSIVPARVITLYNTVFTAEERKKLEEYFLANPKLFKELASDPERLIRFVEEFLAKGQKGGAR